MSMSVHIGRQQPVGIESAHFAMFVMRVDWSVCGTAWGRSDSHMGSHNRERYASWRYNGSDIYRCRRSRRDTSHPRLGLTCELALSPVLMWSQGRDLVAADWLAFPEIVGHPP